MSAPKVTIIGGGLAGMIAGLRLLQSGCSVSLFEASGRWGGKAGATLHDGRFEEHGYHIFPAWYRNIWQLVDELELREHFKDCTEFKQLHAGHYPDCLTFTNITSARYLWRNLTSHVMPFAETFLFFYAALDLMSQPYRYRAKLDEVTVTGFLRSRFYRTERVAQQFQELMLKGISVPTYEVSAMTMRNVMRFWVKSPEPMHRILKGNLQSLWIDPIVGKLSFLGASLNLGRTAVELRTEGERVRSVRFVDAQGKSEEHQVDCLLLAIPVEKVTELISDRLYASAPQLGELRHLRTRPMAAFNIYFRKRVPDMPSAHVNLLDSRYGISFIDVAQSWDPIDTTTLNLIASDVTDIEHLSPEIAVSAMMEDLRRYIPFTPEDVRLITFQSHSGQPLFMNNVGGWTFRPTTRTQIKNLYLAGDYAQNPIDLVSMEGAVSSGLMAAEAIRADAGIEGPIKTVIPPVYPRWLTVLGRVVLNPCAALAKLWMLFTDSDYNPGASDVPPFDPESLPRWPIQVLDESLTGVGETARSQVPE